jgi:hypothetical protein
MTTHVSYIDAKYLSNFFCYRNLFKILVDHISQVDVNSIILGVMFWLLEAYASYI